MIPLARLAVAASIVVSGGLIQQPRPLFQSGTRTVTLHAAVRADDGRLVPDLRREAFTVLDNGRPADITVLRISRSPPFCSSTPAGA